MILRDPVHGLVAFETEEEAIIEALLGAIEVQRLRRLRQMGLASLAYPGADHTRFSHALGAAFVMRLLIQRLRALDHELPAHQRLTPERAREALAAALLHDLGHGPFSHLFEQVLPHAPRHEEWTVRIVLDPSTEVHQILRRFDSQLPVRVSGLIQGKHELPFLAGAVSGTFDVDRCDYLLRDAHSTGVTYGRFDLDWLLRSLRFGLPEPSGEPPSLAIDGTRGIPAIESFLLARLFMFQQVYFHKTERASEWMLARIFAKVGDALANGARLPCTPAALATLAQRGSVSLGAYLALDDAALWVAFNEWRNADDPIVRDLAQRFYARRLFKTYELFGEHATIEGRAAALEATREVARRAGLDPDVYTGLDAASMVAFDGRQDPLQVVFPAGRVRPLSEVSFLLGRLENQCMERVRLVFAPELRDAVVRAIEA